MPYKITRSESYKADQTKSGDSLKHYGRKGMKWGKEIFGEEDVPGQRGGSSSSAPSPSKALSSALNSRVSVGSAKPAMAKSQAQVLSEYYGKGRKMGPEDIGKVKPLFTSNASIKGATIDAANRAYELKKKYTGPNPAEVLANKRLADSRKAKATASKKQQEPVKDTRSGIQKWFDQAGKDIGNTFNSAKKGVEDAASSVKNWGEGAVNDTKKWVEGAANDAKKWTDNAIKDVSKAAVKVGDDAKKVAEKAKTTIDFAVNDAKKWTDNAIKDIGKAAVKMGDDAKKAYGDAEKWVNGAIKDVGNAAVKVGDDAKKAYGDAKNWVDRAIGDTKKWVEGAASTTAKEVNALVDDIVNGRHSKRNRLREKAYDSKVKRDRVLSRGNGPQLDEMDMNRAFSKAPYARSNSTELQRDTGRLRTENWRTKRSIAPKLKTPKVVGPSGADAKKYLQGQGFKNYQDAVKQLSKNPNDRSAREELDFFDTLIRQRKKSRPQ